MKYFIVLTLLLSGCSVGPFHLTHEYGQMPKVDIDSGIDGCKIRPKIQPGDLDFKRVDYTCKWKTDFLN